MRSSDHRLSVEIQPPCLELPPILVNLPHGLTEEGRNDLSFRVLINKNKQSQGAIERMVVGENESLELLGTNFQNDSIPPSVARYGVLAYSPSQQSLKLHFVPHVYSMTQEVKPMKRRYSGEDPLTSMERLAEQNSSDRQPSDIDKELTLAFGSKIRKVTQNRRSTYSLDGKKTDTTAGDKTIVDDLNEAANDTAVVTGGGAIMTSNAPYRNTDATEPEDVYPLSELIPPTLRQYVPVAGFINWIQSNDSDALLKSEEAKQYCSFVKNRIPFIKSVLGLSTKGKMDPSTKDSVARVHSICLLFINSGISLYTSMNHPKTRNGIHKPEELGEIIGSRNTKVIKFFLDRFSEQEQQDSSIIYRFSSASKARLLMWIISIGFHSDQYVLDLTDLVKDTGENPEYIVSHTRALGAKVKGRNERGIPVVQLRLPLKFPFKNKKSTR
ncbi:putative DNA-directed RNA polymerase I subunit RPA49 [Blattamonas nauphoetae]|uniref:DNA-directed RNA polymerase I subunit RPA49 n=1 Tax=Blattamonas nauphoetae TaxID=2049346 RepID=A0ABQ9YEM7_9EUKA|nr:putative DNA-directed RNA polymerase I subunit RPA49 [Blattamonas nauphoetae]